MPFKTFTAAVLSSSDMNTYLMKQAVITCTSGTRPASPVQGMTIYETDTNLCRIYDGTNWREDHAQPQSIAFTPAGTTDTPAAGSATWITLGNLTVPAGYTKARFTCNIAGFFEVAAGSTNVTLQFKVGTPASTARRILGPVSANRATFSWSDTVTGLTAGSQAVVIAANYVSGSSVFRVDTNCTISAAVDWAL